MKTHKEVNVEDIVSTAARENWGRNLPGGTEILFRRHSRNTWLDYDVAWLFRRDFEQMTLANGGEGPTEVFWNRPVPLYDAVRGLLEAKRRASSPHTSTEADHCIAATLEETTREGKPLYARFLHRLARSQPLTFGLPPELTTDDPNVLQEVATLQLFSCDGGCNIPSEAKMMALEICIRLTHWMYAGTESRMQNPGASPDGPPQRLPIQWVVEMMEQPDNGITKEKMKDIRYQVRLIVQQFFKRAKTSHQLLAANGSMDTNVYLSRFLSSAAKILTMTRDLDGGTGDHWHDICTEIIECIQSGDSDLTSDYAFQAALMFCEAILTHSGSKVVVAESQSLRDFVQIICKHEASVGQRPREAVVHYDRARRLFMEKVQDPMLGIDTGIDPSILAKLAGGWSDSSLGHFSIQIDTDASSTISDFSQAAEISDNTRAVTS
ncbi:hypothetical protein EST38_g3319 [Candolleomyces aberdarensis]|uniref:Uncharacterized protein n=1 Tax=Candolleomyces aberdarensis TaxID=2316362 RepID=A0A4Q2DQR8_9AGAR|nr:hypothetical protein EST38_g3319 [Candolleomyces aberdarensis]